MSLSISGTTAFQALDNETAEPKQQPAKPTESQVMQQMLSAGDSVSEIAAQTGVSETLVDSTLGLQTTSTSTASGPTAAASASAMKLSVRA